ALPRRHSLRRRELCLEVERLALPRKAQPLVGEDVAGDDRGDQREPENRAEVLPVLGDGAPHRLDPRPLTASSDSEAVSTFRSEPVAFICPRSQSAVLVSCSACAAAGGAAAR